MADGSEDSLTEPPSSTGCQGEPQQLTEMPVTHRDAHLIHVLADFLSHPRPNPVREALGKPTSDEGKAVGGWRE